MDGRVTAIPDGYVSVTPHLCIRGAADALEFYKKVFGAVEIMRFPQRDGRIGHAEMQIGDSKVMLSDEYPEMGYLSPKTRGGPSVSLMLYVEDVDGVVARAALAGARVIRPVKNQFYGDRTGSIEDPFGHTWHIATHVEDVSSEELQRRATEQEQY